MKNLKGKRKCSNCLTEKDDSEFYKGRSNKCKTCRNIDHQKWVNNNRDKTRRTMRNTNYKREHGITYDEYVKMFNEVGGLCQICGRSFEKLCIDHCHESGVTRGLLCNSCNIGIGHFEDNPNSIRSAIDYLKQYE